MLRIFLSLFLIWTAGLFASIKPTARHEKAPHSYCDAVVSIPPIRYLVREIAGDTLNIALIVPPGLSPHDFEPKARDILKLTDAKIWFQIGEGFEKRLDGLFSEHTQRINLCDGIVSTSNANPPNPHSGCCHSGTPYDTHIWLCPRLLKQQAHTIASALSALIPEQATYFADNLEAFLHKLTALDEEILSLTRTPKHRTVLVVHPAFGYFCLTYGFEQLAIEEAGKEPSPRYLHALFSRAKREELERIFISPEYSTKQARVIARELNAELISIDPYAENCIDTVRSIAIQFSQ